MNEINAVAVAGRLTSDYESVFVGQATNKGINLIGKNEDEL